MILFHGTVEEHIKDIRKKGLLATTTDQWLLEITNKKVCCFSKRPVSGEGGNPLFFARNREQNGYIVVVDIPQKVLLEEKLITAFDNKILDDYVQRHFFIRQEFRHIGYSLYQALQKYKQTDSSFQKIDIQIKKRSATSQDSIIFSPDDQREYYKDLRDLDNRFVMEFLGVKCSDEMWDFMQYIGLWLPFWKFLVAHFGDISKEVYDTFQEKFQFHSHQEFWKAFYQTFPLQIMEEKYQSWKDWFSPVWLTSRQLLSQQDKSTQIWLMGHKMADFGKNCQLLASSMESKYILGCIHVTTPSRILPEFLYQKKSGIVQAIWDKVEKMKAKN